MIEFNTSINIITSFYEKLNNIFIDEEFGSFGELKKAGSIEKKIFKEEYQKYIENLNIFIIKWFKCNKKYKEENIIENIFNFDITENHKKIWIKFELAALLESLNRLFNSIYKFNIKSNYIYSDNKDLLLFLDIVKDSITFIST
jgi:hypothetical protein